MPLFFFVFLLHSLTSMNLGRPRRTVCKENEHRSFSANSWRKEKCLSSSVPNIILINLKLGHNPTRCRAQLIREGKKETALLRTAMEKHFFKPPFSSSSSNQVTYLQATHYWLSLCWLLSVLYKYFCAFL
ncbi:Uncharacterized protein Rs2_26791 [Raphanus sativus]|nr:Uncharacterized protein Rs2_26791 [Raphanus sativus]